MKRLDDKVKKAMKDAFVIYQSLYPLIEELEQTEGYKLGEERCWVYSHFAQTAFNYLGYDAKVASGGFIEWTPEPKENKGKAKIKKPLFKTLECLLQYSDLSKQEEPKINRAKLVKYKDFLPHHWIKLKVNGECYAVDLLPIFVETKDKIIRQPVCHFMRLGEKGTNYYPYDEKLEGFKVLNKKQFIEEYFGGSKGHYQEILEDLIDKVEEALG